MTFHLQQENVYLSSEDEHPTTEKKYEDGSLRKKGIKAICRKDFAPSNYSKVCELHFAEDTIGRNTEVYDKKTGHKMCSFDTLLTAKLCFAIYISMSSNPARECPKLRQQRIENEHLQRPIQENINSKQKF
ncbi:hypothetical protein NPIL_325291 [Nephila pilipes]|uniref:THAP-type domain-containing protein n=1 Tax=Nephila pilipes TaxID=299642 RepID=A0A8X6T5U2_NEPPI|nr:hypothetical protein NPIL_325291 [Nephila pilipes]